METAVIAEPSGDLPRRRLTAHGRARCRQRGVRETDIGYIIEFGDVYHAGGGDLAYFLGWRASARARRVAGVDIDHLRNTALVMPANGAVRTLLRLNRPRPWWKPTGRRARIGRGRWKGGTS